MTTSEIDSAAAALAAGELVAFPTETVYGLGADAANTQAVAKIYALKGRPSNHPVIVHVTGGAAVPHWASRVPPYAQALIDAFWPGPLTLILLRSSGVPDAVTGGQDTVGLRCPAHPMAQALLKACAALGLQGLAAPSANRFGRVSPTTAAHVREEFGDALPVLDGGPCSVGIESTIIDCTGDAPVLLRPGAVSREQVARATGLPVQDRDAASPRASGTLPAHYQPATPVRLIDDATTLAGHTDAALYARRKPEKFAGAFRAAPPDAARYAQDLYAALRALDALQLAIILIESPDGVRESTGVNQGLWAAIMDRLRRAASTVS